MRQSLTKKALAGCGAAAPERKPHEKGLAGVRGGSHGEKKEKVQKVY